MSPTGHRDEESDNAWRSSAHVAQLLMEHMPAGLFVYRLAADGTLRLVYANPEAERLRGVRINERRSDNFDDIWPEALALGITQKFVQVIKTGRPFKHEQLSYADARMSGVTRVRAFRLDEEHLAVAFQDITKLQEQERALRESEARFRILARASNEGIMLTRQLTLIDCNARLPLMFGYTREELVGRSPEQLVAEGSREMVAKIIQDKGERPGRFRFQAKRKDGSVFPAEAKRTLTEFRGEQVRLTVVRDRSDEEQMLSLEHLAVTDSLTGLHNHRYFQESLRNEIERSERYEHPVSLLIIDIDHFKRINDQHGHQEGDEVLRQLARLLKEETRKADVVARYGGEEFAVILPNANSDSAFRSAERIRERVANCPLGTKSLTVTVTVGAAVFPDHASDFDSLFAAADKALYEGKNAGRNRSKLAISKA